VNTQLIKFIPLVVAFIASGLVSSVHAQENSGLKLGQPDATTENKLDLGAAPPASRQTPEATAVAPAAPEGVQRTTYGAWEVACADDGSNCAMAQIGNDDSGTPILEMVIRKLAEPLEVGERTAIAVLDVITPLGVVLVEGLSVTIDGGNKESAPFQICTCYRCQSGRSKSDTVTDRFHQGFQHAEVALEASVVKQGDTCLDFLSAHS